MTVSEAFKKQLDKYPPITEAKVKELKGKPFTGEYDEQGEKIFSFFQVGEQYITCMIQQGFHMGMVVTTDTYLDNLADNHEFVEMKQDIFPLLKRKLK